MWYMDIVIFKGGFNEMYRNNSKFIAFSIQDTVIHINENDWRFCATISLVVNHLYTMPPSLIVKVVLLSYKRGRGLW